MNKKIIALLAVLMIVPVVGAVEITPNTLDITSTPQNSSLHNLHVNVNESGNETATISSSQSWITFNSTYFDSDGSLKVTVLGKGTGNYSGSIQVNDSDMVDVNYEVKESYETVWQGWLNTSQAIVINGNQYNVSGINSKVFFDSRNNRIGIKYEKELSGTIVELIDIIPGEYAKINIKSKDSANFQLKSTTKKKKEEEPECKLGVKTITTLRRGATLSIETIDDASSNKKIVPGVGVTLLDDGARKEQEIGHTVSDSTGYARMYVPAGVKGPVVARLSKPDSKCESNNKRISFRVPYNQYIEDSDKFSLKVNPEKKNFSSEKIEGMLLNKRNEKIGTGYIRVTYPNGNTEKHAVSNSTFSFSVSDSGTYKLKGIKVDFSPSSVVRVTYSDDKDGDGVTNSEDDCPNLKGEKSNNGCPLYKSEVMFMSDGKEVKAPSIGEIYDVVVMTNGSVSNYTGKLEVTPPSKEEPFNISINDGRGSLEIKESGEYELSFSGSDKLEKASEDYDIEGESLDTEMIMGIGVIVLVLLVALFVYPGFLRGGREEDNSDVQIGLAPRNTSDTSLDNVSGLREDES